MEPETVTQSQPALARAVNLNQPRVLVLNVSYEPLHVCSVKRAITLMMYGIAEVIENSDDVVRSPSTVMPVPSVIRLKRYIRRPRVHPIPFSRRNVMRRDFYTCQYCGSRQDLTLDHVLPRSRGGRHIWENVVVACRSCNQRKGNKTPEEIGFRLRVPPKAPSFGLYAYGHASEWQPTWQKYIY
ncbi:5-methylcytosine-specific restriction endonuclease McrA [Deinobacterium chartae]|uniref:5-methylcytosine-specific restriction endonuclease McrA n=1 Tax=Deinobacterium chartae TaxID=521158 RepID=A0A841I492_9DEIO|nr:5-methylcytosine-specific restriction endonuclease McrA [Deinobacterium chartae]